MKTILTVMLLAVAAGAQPLPEAPAPKSHVQAYLNAFAVSGIILDGISTRLVVTSGGSEGNVLARPFAGSATGEAIAGSLGVAAMFAGEHIMRHHSRIVRAIPTTVGLIEWGVAVNNLRTWRNNLRINAR